MQAKTDLGVNLAGGKTGVLLLHDVGGAAVELRAHATAFARQGYTVACPQLIALGDASVAGHGSAGMLVSEAEQALARLKSKCENVVAVGMSYGAMLALELARHNAGSVQAAMLVDPRTWLPGLPRALPSALSGRVRQAWLAPLVALARTAGEPGGPNAGARSGNPAVSTLSSPATLRQIGRLLDSVHAGLPAIQQPVLIVHRPGSVRSGRDGTFILQRRLGGRVESVMIEEQAAGSSFQDDGADGLVERGARFVAAVLEEIVTRRDNELRRQKAAAGRTDAA